MAKQRLATLTREEKLKRLELLQEKKRRIKSAKPVYKPHPGQLAVHLDEHPIRLVTSGNGCWAPGTKFRKADGSLIKVEDVRLGEKLLGPDGTERTVIQLWQGTEPMYKIIPKQSDPVVVNESHILTLRRWKKIPGTNGDSFDDLDTVTVKQYLEWGAEKQRTSYQWRPEGGVEYPTKSLQIDPYILGLWLGDGHSATSGLTNIDPEIISCWYEEARKRGCSIRVQTQKASACCSYFIRGETGRNTLLEDLRGYEILNNKHIPQVYKISSRAQRLELLAGLIDTDGSLSGGNYEIIQKREALADDIRELAQSLGFKASKRIKMINGTPYYRLNILGDIERIPVRVERKKYSGKHQRASNKEAFVIEPVGVGEFVGFTVDKDNLILLADYTAQHNSGKSTLLTNEAWWAAKGWNPVLEKFTKVPARIGVLLDSPGKVEDVFIREMAKWYNVFEECEMSKKGKPHVSEILFKNGSRITFFFHQQEPLAFEGVELDYVLMDEPPPRDVFIGIMRGNRTKGSKFNALIIGTPLGQPWLYEELYVPASRGERDDVGLHRFDTEYNRKNLADGYIEAFAKNLSEKEKRIRLGGEFFHLDGLALAHLFQKDTHVVPDFQWPRGKPVVIAIDPHPAKSHIALMCGATGDGRIYAIKELASRATPRQFARELREWMEGVNVVDIIVDSLGNTPMSGGDGNRSFIEVLNAEGVRCRATTFEDKSDEEFINRIRDVLEVPEVEDNFGRKIPKLAIMESCRNLIHDIEHVAWLKYKGHDMYKPKLDITNKDYLACLKYALSTNIAYTANGIKPKIFKPKSRSPWSGASR